MPNQPPPAFGGPPNYPQQWPPPYPSMMPPDFHTNPEYLAAAQMPPFNPNLPFDPNMAAFYANAQLTGPASHAHPYFPPPLPFMNPFDPSQIPPQPFPPMPMPPLDYTSMQAPAGSSNPKLVSAKVAAANENQRPQPEPRQQPKTTAGLIDGNREEGEISDEENEQPGPKDAKASNSARWKRPPSQHSDMEEGETTSSRSRASSRSSTPYNPPLSVAADPEVLDRAIELQKRESTTTTLKDSPLSRSAIQLRVQAQGALLSLVPHNIQYNELVAEGLNPAILRELYKQVGIKVTTEAEKSVQNATAQVPVSNKLAQSATPNKVNDVRPKSSIAPPVSASATSSAPQSDSGKPMERKEVIARMLAAKAAKSSEAATKAVPKETRSVAATPTPTPSTTPSDTQTKSTVVPMRGKNKAQTELARKRIEELKRQALLKNQQKAQLNQATNVPPVDQPADDSSNSSSAAPVTQHPLPVRPPVAQPSESATIPGLFMTGSKQAAGLQSPTETSQGIAVDSAPVSRAGQRKRPRASDFDEPDAAYKKQLGHGTGHLRPADRVVIEFSDDDEDESLYGDDPDSMDVDSNHETEAQPAVALDNSRPALQKYPSSTSTPQGLSWQSDNENMRQKDLEIQAMHRKIALLEQQRKARKAKEAANRIKSPRTVDDSATSSSSAEHSSPMDVYEAETSISASTAKAAAGTSTTMSSFADQPNLIDSFSESSVHVLASLNLAQLESIRSKVLQMKDIESDLSGMDPETIGRDSGFAACKDEADKLLFDITKANEVREGQVPLIEELKKIGYEIGGLSLEFLDELRRQAEAKEQLITQTECMLIEWTPSIALSRQIPNSLFAVTSSSQVSASADREENDMDDTHASIPHSISTPPLVAQEPEADSSIKQANDLAASPSSPSQSESSGSAMDESEDISSPREGLPSDEEPATLGEQQILDSVASLTQAQTEAASILGPNPIVSTGDGFADSLGIEQGSSERESPSEPPVVGSLPTSLSSGHGTGPASGHPIPEGPLLDVTERNTIMEDHGNQDAYAEQSLRESSAASEESEAYEPPEPDTTAEPNSPYSPPFSPAPLEDPENDMAMLDDLPADKPLTGASQVPVLEPQPDSQVGILGNQTSSTPATSDSKFTPYVSPLRSFKAYRYHPSYTEDVSDGYRSLTYSHDIDSMNYFCPYELAGGVCNDRSCQFQHFRDMTLSDDKILIELGSVREGETEEEKETYLAGLKEIINEMRRDKVKDFSTVAAEIAAYRRRFLQDPSRVLSL
ncbi:hypothetical protein N7486_007855 [Penicillium sp. IBT 16267x]|nr:hypothetical protein N7486_007855 [Penicillium sp. IBT 16267x]